MIKCNVDKGVGSVEAKGTAADVLCEWVTVLENLLNFLATRKNEFEALKYATLKVIENDVNFDAEGTNAIAIKIPIKEGDK